MGDPLSDPRASRLLAADSNEVGQLASLFQRVSGQAQTASHGLQGAQGDATWIGLAADAFRHQLGKLPGDLDKVQRSYGDVASALSGYEGQLGPIQSQFRVLAGQLSSARGSLSTAQGQLAGAQTSLHTASLAPRATATSPAVVQATGAVQSASGAVGRLQGEVSGLESRGYQLLDEFDKVRGHARSAVSSAAGIAPSQSWLSGALSAIGNFMSGAGHVVASIALGVVHSAESLPSDVVNVFEHPTDLHNWAKLGEDVGTVAGAVALVAAVVVCPADALGLEAAAGALAATADGAGTVGLVAGIEKTGADGGLAAEGEGSWASVGFDAAGVAATFVKVPGLQGAEDQKALLGVKSAALEKYGLARALGATHDQAYADLSATQRMVLTKSAAKLSDPGRLSYMRTSTTEAIGAAESHVRHLDAINESVHFVYDKASGAAREAVVPKESK